MHVLIPLDLVCLLMEVLVDVRELALGGFLEPLAVSAAATEEKRSCPTLNPDTSRQIALASCAFLASTGAQRLHQEAFFEADIAQIDALKVGTGRQRSLKLLILIQLANLNRQSTLLHTESFKNRFAHCRLREHLPELKNC